MPVIVNTNVTYKQNLKKITCVIKDIFYLLHLYSI